MRGRHHTISCFPREWGERLAALTPRLITFSIVSLLLSLLTVLLFGMLSAYRAVGPDLVRGGEFESMEFWQLSRTLREQANPISNGVIHLEAHHASQDILARQRLEIPASRQLLVLASGVEVYNGASTSSSSGLPTIAVVGRDAAGRLVGGFDNVILRQAGTLKIDTISQTVQVPVDHSEIWLELEINGGTGVLRVDRLQAFEAELIPWVAAVRQVLAVIWIGLTLMALFFLWNTSKVGSIGLLGVLMLTVVFPSPWESIMSSGLYEMTFGLRNVGLDHGVVFFLGTVASYGLFPRNAHYSWDIHFAILLSWLALASSTESLQYFTGTRIPLLSDWVANLLGIMMAGVVATMYQFFSRLITRP